MQKDTEILAGKFRGIEATVRMIKERKDKKKHTDLEFHKVLSLITEADGFSNDEVEMLRAANRLSGSIAHGNYSEFMDKIEKFVEKQYFSGAKLSRKVVSKTSIDPGASGEEIIDSIVNGTRELASSDKKADIFEAYLVAKTGGYINLADKFADNVSEFVKSKL